MILLALMLIVEIPHAQKCSVYHIWVPVLLYLSIYRSIYLYVCPSNYLPISLCMCIYINIIGIEKQKQQQQQPQQPQQPQPPLKNMF